VTCTPDDLDRMQEVAWFHGKRPYEPFEPDSATKWQAASAQLRELAQQWLDPLHEQLEALRLRAPTRDARPSRTSP